MPVAFSAFHWQPVRRTKKMASMAARSGTRGLWQPSGCGGRGGNSGSSRAHSASETRHRFAASLIVRTSSGALHAPLESSAFRPYWDRV